MESQLGDVRDTHKKSAAVMRVRVPVMIISLEESRYKLCIGETSDLVEPLPRFKLCSVNVQRAEADKTYDNLSYNVYECLRGQSGTVVEPVPFIKTIRVRHGAVDN